MVTWLVTRPDAPTISSELSMVELLCTCRRIDDTSLGDAAALLGGIDLVPTDLTRRHAPPQHHAPPHLPRSHRCTHRLNRPAGEDPLGTRRSGHRGRFSSAATRPSDLVGAVESGACDDMSGHGVQHIGEGEPVGQFEVAVQDEVESARSDGHPPRCPAARTSAQSKHTAGRAMDAIEPGTAAVCWLVDQLVHTAGVRHDVAERMVLDAPAARNEGISTAARQAPVGQERGHLVAKTAYWKLATEACRDRRSNHDLQANQRTLAAALDLSKVQLPFGDPCEGARNGAASAVPRGALGPAGLRPSAARSGLAGGRQGRRERRVIPPHHARRAAQPPPQLLASPPAGGEHQRSSSRGVRAR